MYPELKTTVSPDEREHVVLESWKHNNVFRRSIEERDADKIFSFYEGPPTVNGVPGIHHVFSRTIKDAICRYKTMRGFRVERKAGWDTHGLPVEIAVEKELGFRHKSEIVEYGVDKFVEKCRSLVYSNIDRDAGWKELTERMGYWVNMDDPYITCTNDYIESVWWALKQFHDKGLIYKGFKIQPYCPRCETALSSHEVALGYKDTHDPSVFIRFRILSKLPDQSHGQQVHFLVWTTTPWTLPFNVALALNPDIQYVEVKNERPNRQPEYLILAESLLKNLEGEWAILNKFSAEDLEGFEYEPVLKYWNDTSIEEEYSDIFHTVLADFVSDADGSGIVHIAPFFGQDDLDVVRSMRYRIPMLSEVNTSGRYNQKMGYLDARLIDVFFKDADSILLEKLKTQGSIYRRDSIVHSYPFCWRCDTPLLYYARPGWYIQVTKYKDDLISENKKINWQPPEIRDGRFGNWLEELKDWNLSRERFWGTPLPIWEKRYVGEPPGRDIAAQICVGSFHDFLKEHDIPTTIVTPDQPDQGFEGLFHITYPNGRFKAFIRQDNGVLIPFERIELEGFDPHKPYVDNIEFHDVSGNTNLILRRTPEVIDVWFDSGSMPFAQHHYMAEGEAGSIPPPPGYPADFISEGVDQTRGWFYTLHAINTFLFGKAAYRNVIVNDMLLDKNGQKMSKSKGNVVSPFEVLTKYGADATRWYLLSAAVPWKPRSFNPDDLGELERKFFGTLTNTYGFFALYANIDKFSYNPDRRIPELKRPEVDRWVLSQLNSLTSDCRKYLDEYDLTKPARAIQDFVTEQLSNWYIRRNRRRFWKGEQNEDKQAAYDTLYECLLTVAKLMAPIAPFFADWMYDALRSENRKLQSSVHLEMYPEGDSSVLNPALEKRMAAAQIVSSLVRQMRERAKIRVRQPLERILIPVQNRREIEELRKVEEVIREEVNVKRVEYVEAGDSDVIKLKAKANFKTLGARLGKAMKVVASRVQSLSQDDIRKYQQQGGLSIEVDGTVVTLERGDIEVIAEDVEGWLVSSEGGMTVALDTHMTPELTQEGMAREFVNRVQNLRKDSGFDVTDRIGISVDTQSKSLLEALLTHSNYIRQETLAEALITDAGPQFSEAESAQIEILDETATVQIVRTN